MVSIIIPCFNSEKYIDDCISSVICQTYQNFEIICINDGSIDGTLNKLNVWQEKYPNKIYVLNVMNKGASVARNLGLDFSKGEYIQFLDSDDLLSPDKLFTQVNGFELGVDYVVSDREDRSEDLNSILKVHTFEELEKSPLETAITRIIITGNPLYRRSCVIKVNGYNENLTSAQDWDFHIRLVLANLKGKYIPGVFYYNRKLTYSISANWIKVSHNMLNIIMHLKYQIRNHVYYNEKIESYISNVIYNNAIYTKDSNWIKRCILEYKCWNPTNKLYVNNFFKGVILKYFGVKLLIYIDRVRLSLI
jgi:glycosyltransferase involved in cell wall biosynthesis